MTLDHIHHVAIIVSDYEKAKDFYVNQLELEVIRENYRAKRDDWKLDLRLGDCELEIFWVKNPPARVNRPEACGLRHLAFAVRIWRRQLHGCTVKVLRQSLCAPMILQGRK